MLTREEIIKARYAKKTYEKKEKERRDLYIKNKVNKICEDKRKIKYSIKCKDEIQRSHCTEGYYSTKIEQAFHNCFVREKNFKGYIDEFQEVIEKSFTEGMSWENYGEWEIDHIIPLAKGGAHSVKNIQALWKPDNRSKGANII